MFQPASQPEIIRSNQKDQFYVAFLRNSLADICQSFAGARVWARWRQELDILGEVLYFGLTTVAGYQTLGEEYVNILQVDKSRRAVPPTKTRLALLLLYACSPYLLDKVLASIPHYLESEPARAAISPEHREKITQCVPLMRQAITIIQRTHMALFYLKGVFYHLSKRLTGIQYLMVRRGTSAGSLGPSFHLLGWLSITQLGISLLHALYHMRQGRADGNQEAAIDVEEHRISADTGLIDPRLRCSLCLDRRRSPTATPCGHLFCWDCITEWCSTKPECPLCREKFQLSRLIFLQNFEAR